MSSGSAGVDLVFVWGSTEGIGGTETRMAEVALTLRQRGHVVLSIVLTPERSTRLSRLLAASSEIRFAESTRQLARELRERQPTAVLAFGLRASLKSRLAVGFVRNRPRLLDARNGLEHHRGRLAWFLDKLTWKGVAVFLANSYAVRRQLLERGVKADRVVVNRSALSEQWAVRADGIRDPELVVMIGNARPEKNHLQGISAIARVSGPVRVRVYTDEADDLRAAWKTLNTDASKSIDFVEDHRVSPQDLACAAIILHPSLSESLPRVLLEARSQGVFPVATDVGDTRDVVGSDGILVPSGDLDALVTALDRALNLSRAGELDLSPFAPRSVSDYCDDLLGVCGIR